MPTVIASELLSLYDIEYARESARLQHHECLRCGDIGHRMWAAVLFLLSQRHSCHTSHP